MKKVLSLIVTAVMLLQMGLCAFAQSDADVVLSVSNVEADAGDTVEVALTLDTNPGISGMTLTISYPESMTLTDVEVGTALNGLEMAPYTIKNPLVVTWYAMADVDSTTGELLNLTFEVAEDAVPGEDDAITVVCDEVVDGDLTALDFEAIGGVVAITPAPVPTVEVSVSDVEADSGETVEAVVSMETNPGISGMTLTIGYPETMTLTNVEAGSALAGLEMAPYTLKNPLVVTWYATADVDSSTGELLTLTFDVAEDAVPEEDDVITVVCDEVVDGNLNPINFAEVEGGNVTINHIHTYTSKVTKEASCTEPGVITYTCACGHTYTEETDLAEHTWGEVTVKVEATCTTAGEQSATCEVCGVSDVAIVIPALGHTYDEGVVTKEATCKEAGEKTFTCEVCGNVTTEAIAKLAHTYGEAVVVEPTCTEAGSKTFTCDACGENVVEKLAATGHTFGDWEVVEEATEDEEGLEKRICSVCGEKETRVIDKVDDNKWSYLVQTIRLHALRQQKANKNNVKVEVEEVEEEPEVIDEAIVEETWENPFIDIFESDSYYAAIEFVYENGLFKGVSEIEFAPATTMNRAMFVTVLGRIHGITEDYVGETTFDDVVEGEWYAPYVAWAADNGIVLGYGDGTFGINDEITVEQAAVILARYAAFIELDVVAEYDLAAEYADAADVAEWAAEAMAWAVSEGIYVGVEGYLNPQAPAARALVATMLYNFAQ